jgi:Raf kinase inhibitor-like YbhB/YbcL family protein
MRLTSAAFSDGELIPPKYTCDGVDVSPPVGWADVPDGVRSLALIVEDPDAPRGVFVHWLIYGIPSSESALTEGAGTESSAKARQGRNDFGKAAYGGPCPPSGTHRYFFRLYALDDDLAKLPAAATRQELESAMKEHILAETQLMGRYERKQRNSSE